MSNNIFNTTSFYLYLSMECVIDNTSVINKLAETPAVNYVETNCIKIPKCINIMIIIIYLD